MSFEGKVLIVDDETELRRSIKRYLELEDFYCLEAENGKQAFEIIQKEEIKFVISDVRMPGGDGVDLLKDIKERDINLPVVLLMTGFAEISRQDALDLGALDLLDKPINMDQIINYLEAQ